MSHLHSGRCSANLIAKTKCEMSIHVPTACYVWCLVRREKLAHAHSIGFVFYDCPGAPRRTGINLVFAQGLRRPTARTKYSQV